VAEANDVVGADVVELAPTLDPSGLSALGGGPRRVRPVGGGARVSGDARPADVLLTGIASSSRPTARARAAAPPRRSCAASTTRRWRSPAAAWPGSVAPRLARAAVRTVDLGDGRSCPGLVDPHTHLLWAGDRYDDLEARLAGVPYEAILARGGGIRRTMRATAAADRATLVRGGAVRGWRRSRRRARPRWR
jgi:hypothetical protein